MLAWLCSRPWVLGNVLLALLWLLLHLGTGSG